MSQPTKSEIAQGIANLNKTRSKWGAVKTPCSHGHTHDSGREAKRCDTLHLCERGGVLKGLKFQVKYPLHVNGQLITTYISDFEYWEREGNTWLYTVEDVKGAMTPEFKLKRKLLKALHGIELRLT